MSRHSESLVSPIHKLSDGRSIIEVNYALSCHFAQEATYQHAAGSMDPVLIAMYRRHQENAKKATIPEKARADAAALARGLTEDLQSLRQRWKSRQRRGRLDGRALVRVVEDVQSGRFSEQLTRPYRSKEVISSNAPPRVAIVADYNYRLRESDSTYEKRIGALACAVLWACEAADLPCSFAAVRGDWGGVLKGNAKTSSIAVISRPGAPIDAASYACVTGQFGQGSFIEAHGFATILPNDWKPQGSRNVPGSENGCGGVRWAREIEGASFIVAIGDFGAEAREADVLIPVRSSPAEAIRLIREALAIRQAAAA